MSPVRSALRTALTVILGTAAGFAHGADTACKGNMRHAEAIAEILARHQVKASFFVAQEKTLRGDMSLDPSWADYWKARVAEGHTFGSHTWRHGSFRKDEAGGKVVYRLMDGSQTLLDWSLA